MSNAKAHRRVWKGESSSVCPYIVFYLLCSIFYFIFLEEKLERLLSTLEHHVDISHCICFECCVFTVEKLYFYYVYQFYFIMFDCLVDVGAVIFNEMKIESKNDLRCNTVSLVV